MITKVQGKTLSGEIVAAKPPKLSALEKGLLKWAVVNPDDRVLDANVCEGMIAEYLRRNLQCEVCGVSSNMDHVRSARNRLQSCDIVYAGDIPWRENAFDAVLYQVQDGEQLDRMVGETYRVLKPGGQLVLGLHSYPGPLAVTARLLAEDRLEGAVLPTRQELCQMLTKRHFQQVTWQRTGFAAGVVIAWKPKENVDAFLKKTEM